MSVVDHHALPQVRAVRDELLVDRMVLVDLLSGGIVEEQDLRGAVAVVDDVALLGACRHAEMCAAHRLDFGERAQPRQQSREIFLRTPDSSSQKNT